MTVINFNALADISQEQLNELVDYLGPLYDEMQGDLDEAEKCGQEKYIDLVMGLDKLLEGLGREGHFFN